MEKIKTNFVLIRGLARDSRHWGKFPFLLENSFPGSRVLCLDAPGNGEKHHDGSPLRISAYVDSLRPEFVRWQSSQNRDPACKTVLLAISMGAMIGLDWMTRFSGDFSQAVLINSSFAGLSPIHRRLRFRAMKGFLEILFTKNLFEAEKKILTLTTRMLGAAKEEIAQQWATFAPAKRTSAGNALRQLIAAAIYFAPRANQIPRIPFLILSAKGDLLADSRCSRDFSLYRGGQWLEHPHAGHDLPLDDPEWLIQALSKFLSAY